MKNMVMGILFFVLVFILTGCYSKPVLDRIDHDRNPPKKTPYTDTDKGHTQITQAICNGKNHQAVELIKTANHSEWLVSYKVWREVAEPGKKVTVSGDDPDKYPLLAAVAALGEVNIAQALLNKGAKINARLPDQGSTALMAAAKMKNLNMVRFLLENDADPRIITSNRSATPNVDALDLAIMSADQGDEEKVALELLKAPIGPLLLEERSWIKTRVLVETAAYSGLFQVFQRLVKMGADVFTCNQLGASPIHYAVMGGRRYGEKIALYLIEKGENPNRYYATDKILMMAKAGHFSPEGRRQGKTPLLIAIDENANIDFIEMLLKKGADVNLSSLAGITPLMKATARNHKKLIALFLKYGAKAKSD